MHHPHERVPERRDLRRAGAAGPLAATVTALAVAGCVPRAAGPAATAGSTEVPVTAFVNVAVVPMDRDRTLADQTVLVRDARIMALGSAAQVRVPAGAVRIDGRGKFLIPGLADMHAHVPYADAVLRVLSRPTDSDRVEAERMLFLYLATGVTTVRILHGFPLLLTLRARAAAGELLSPRIYAATPIVFGATPDSAAKIPAAAKAAGYDLVKLYNGLQGTSLDSLVAAARRVGIPFAGHAPGLHDALDGKSLQQAIQAGYASVEHLTGFVGYDGSKAVDSASLRAAAVAMRQAGVWNCPTLILLGSNIGYFTADTFAGWPELRYVREARLQEWRQEWAAKMKNAPRADTALRAMLVRRQIVKALHAAGAGLLLGTDASLPAILPGFAVHRELEALVQAGLTPYEALATGTRNVAAYFGTLDSTGTVAVGKRADLVLLNGNPLQDIRQTTQRAGVMLHGRWLPQAELERQLVALEGMLY